MLSQGVFCTGSQISFNTKKVWAGYFFIAMGEPSFLDRMLSHLRTTSRYYTGYPKDLGPSRVIHFTSERQFVQLLHEGYPVVVAFTIKYLISTSFI
ncbi:hypothetical protein ACLOJK_019380 [Asimina triloba]